MFRRFALALLPLALLTAACFGGDNASDAPETEPTLQPTAVVGDTSPDGRNGASDVLFDTINPFQLLGNLGAEPTSQQVDPSLGAALLDEDDLPDEFASLGQFTFSTPSEFGPIEMAASQFVSGDLEGDFDAIVISSVMAMPPEALREIGDLSELGGAAQEELSQALDEAEELGVGLGDFRLLDASGLGEGGFGMHMELNLGALLGGLATAFGAPEEEIPVAGFAMDMYMFVRGEQMLMLMVMWPLDRSTNVDALELAETMDAKAAAAS